MVTFVFMSFLTYKALHLIFMVSWFAGLFYMIRLFVYHTEAQQKEEVIRNAFNKQYQLMESRLWWVITTPAMILTITFGVLMLVEVPGYLAAPWMHVKLSFVALLVVYHFISQKIMFDLRKGKFKLTSGRLRMWNEVATLVLVAVVFLVVYKNSLDWIKATLIFFGVAIGLMIMIKVYKRIRTNKS